MVLCFKSVSLHAAVVLLCVDMSVKGDVLHKRKSHKKHHRKGRTHQEGHRSPTHSAASIATHSALPPQHSSKIKFTHLKQSPQPGSEALASAPSADVTSAEDAIMGKMKALENKLETADSHHVANHVMMTGKLDVNGPLPADFNALFAQSVAKATEVRSMSCPANEIKVLETNILQTLLQTQARANVIVEIVFQGPAQCVHEAQKQAAAADSPLVADTPMYAFLVAKGETAQDLGSSPKEDDVAVDIDTEMPYGELEPFGREDTAQELTEDSIKESDSMVDQIERAQVAEEKRSVFRALTRLRGAAITSFDGVARSQTGNIDEYNKTHKWRKTHPLHHLAAEEADVTKWAFPATAD